MYNLWFYDLLCFAVFRQLTLDRNLCNSSYCHIEMIAIRKYHYYFRTRNHDLQYLVLDHFNSETRHSVYQPFAMACCSVNTNNLNVVFIRKVRHRLTYKLVFIISGVLSLLIMMVSYLIFQPLKMSSKTSCTNTGSWFVPSLKW